MREAEFFLGGTWVAVDNFNLQAKTARITVTHQVRPKIWNGPAVVRESCSDIGRASTRGSWMDRAPVRHDVPRRSPVLEVLDRLAISAAIEALHAEARRSVERTVVEELAMARGIR